MTHLITALALALQTMLPTVKVDRVNAVTDDMFAVVQEESNSVKGLSMQDETAVALLAAVVVNESGMRESVEKCRINGDGGKSIGLGQVMKGVNWEGYTREQICSNRKLQLKLALHVLDRCWARTPQAAPALRCYTSGSAATDSTAARKELKTYYKLSSIISSVKSKLKPTRTVLTAQR